MCGCAISGRALCWASLAFDTANLAFVWYVSFYAHYNLLYGSVGAILALLTWVYLSAIILLLGAAHYLALRGLRRQHS